MCHSRPTALPEDGEGGGVAGEGGAGQEVRARRPGGALSRRPECVVAELVARGARTQGIRPASNGTPSASLTLERRKLIREIQELFLEKLSIRVEAEEADLFQTGVFDSMTLVQFIFHLEERYEFRMPMEELDVESFHSVTKIAEVVSVHVRNNGGRAQSSQRS